MSIYGPSEAAILAATEAYVVESGKLCDSVGMAAALIAAHDYDLGIDRSVCLRDALLVLKETGAPESQVSA